LIKGGCKGEKNKRDKKQETGNKQYVDKLRVVGLKIVKNDKNTFYHFLRLFTDCRGNKNSLSL